MSRAQVSFYEVESLLGQGTTGLVYRARDRRDGRPVAVKLLRPEANAEPERRSRFLREARAIAAIDHPHIARIYEVDVATLSAESASALGLCERTAGDSLRLPFLALELLDGTDLSVSIGGQPMAEELACELARQMLEALAAAHRAGIVHRDLKPANVRVTSSGQVKLLDFGLAKMIPTGPLDPATASHLTLDGMVMGTLPYLAPEQLQGEIVDGRADLFSFGVLFYEMLTGGPPIKATTLVEYARSLIHSKIEKPSHRRPGLPEPLDRLVLELIATEPGERPPTAEAALARLAARSGVAAEPDRLAPAEGPFVPAASETAPLAESPLQQTRTSPRRWPTWLLVGLPLFLTVALILLLLTAS